MRSNNTCLGSHFLIRPRKGNQKYLIMGKRTCIKYENLIPHLGDFARLIKVSKAGFMHGDICFGAKK